MTSPAVYAPLAYGFRSHVLKGAAQASFDATTTDKNVRHVLVEQGFFKGWPQLDDKEGAKDRFGFYIMGRDWRISRPPLTNAGHAVVLTAAHADVHACTMALRKLAPQGVPVQKLLPALDLLGIVRVRDSETVKSLEQNEDGDVTEIPHFDALFGGLNEHAQRSVHRYAMDLSLDRTGLLPSGLLLQKQICMYLKRESGEALQPPLTLPDFPLTQHYTPSLAEEICKAHAALSEKDKDMEEIKNIKGSMREILQGKPLEVAFIRNLMEYWKRDPEGGVRPVAFQDFGADVIGICDDIQMSEGWRGRMSHV